MNKCELCLNTRPIISENGYHLNCTLSPKAALNCMFGTTNRFLPGNKIKVFISVGMHGRDNNDVNADLKRARENIYKYYKLHYDLDENNIEIIDNYSCKAPSNASRLWYLGEAIKKLGECKLCYFVKGWEKHKGCVIEMEICNLYEIIVIKEPE